MARIDFRKLPLLQRSVLSFLVAVMWFTVSAADENGVGWRRHSSDQVTISGTPVASITAGQTYSFTPTASDSLGRTLVFAISNMPAWATFNTSSGQLSGTPSAGNVGTYSNIVIGVSDGWKSATLPAFAVQVLASASTGPSTSPPTISGTPPTSDVAGNAYSFQPTASSPSGKTLSF